MNIAGLVLENFRNHSRTEVSCASGVNVFFGENGQGKTSILEAIAVCGLSKTFVQSPDAALIQRSKTFAYSSLSAHTDLQTPYKVSVKIAEGERKQIASSHGTRLSPQDIIGELPLVILSPDFKNITAGAPQDRRQFLDMVISQASKRYMKDAIAHKHTLKQRNALLQRGKKEMAIDENQLQLWTEALVDIGAQIALRRLEFLREFSDFMQNAYAEIARNNETVEMSYLPHSLPKELFTHKPSVEDVKAGYRKAFEQRKFEERARGITVVGTQKDEILLKVNGGIARECASQGQHKTLLISLKIAEFQYLKETRVETPVILLDDVFAELDFSRSANVLELMKSDAQTFVTTTDSRIFHENFSASGNHGLFEVKNGDTVRIS